jgi:pilus assembly protein CpaB
MNRQHALLIFGAAWISAALLTWLLYATTQTPHMEKTVAVVAAARDMPAGTLLRKGDLMVVHMRQGDAPRTAILDEKLALDRPLLFPVTANEPLTSSRIASAKGIEGLSSTIEVGMRAIAIPINDASGVAGLIQPRAHVDVLFTKAGQMSDAVTTTLLEDVVVLAIGRSTEATSSATTAAATQAAALRPPAQSATLLATPEQAQLIELAKNLGKVSLALRNPLDDTSLENATGTIPDDIYPGLGRKEAPVRQPPPPVKVVERAAPPAAKEKPKPKSIVEVFRGTQHVQEIFQ